MIAPLTLKLEFDGVRAGELIDETAAALVAALKLEALAEVRERLLDLLQVPDQLFRVDIEGMARGAFQCRTFLQLTDAGRNLTTALRAGDVNLLVVKEALGHFDFSEALQRRVDAESSGGNSVIVLTGGAA